MNYAHVAGYLGTDPEVRFTSNGQKVTTLRVGCKTRKKGTIWWRVTLWGESFDKIVSYLKKGSSVIAIGDIIEPEIYADKEGNNRVSMQLTAHHISFSPFGKPREEGEQSSGQSMQKALDASSGGAQEPSEEPSPISEEFSDEEIPF